MRTPTNHNRNMVIAAAVVVAALLLAAGVIGIWVTSGGDDGSPGGVEVRATVPESTTIDEQQAPTDDRPPARSPARRSTAPSSETLVGATVTLAPYVEVCATILGFPACARL